MIVRNTAYPALATALRIQPGSHLLLSAFLVSVPVLRSAFLDDSTTYDRAGIAVPGTVNSSLFVAYCLFLSGTWCLYKDFSKGTIASFLLANSPTLALRQGHRPTSISQQNRRWHRQPRSLTRGDLERPNTRARLLESTPIGSRR